MSDNPQTRIWNDVSGTAWSVHAEHFDAMLEPFGEAVLARLDVRDHERVVDVGCGTGATTVRLASIAASSTGVDLSAPMLAAARGRAAAAGATNIDFLEADVEAAPFGSSTFDVAFSRLGVMFFTDPVRAFGHVRQSLVDGGRLGFVCFGPPPDNPFILVPVMAAAAHLPMLPPPGPADPGPFSLANPERTGSILAAAGFGDVSIERGPASMTIGPADDLPGVARRALEQNPGTAAGLVAATPTARDTALAATAAALEPHIVDGQVVLGASTWIVTATAS